MTTPTPEQFMALSEPDESDDFDVEPLEPGTRDPLESIAVSLQAIAANFVGVGRETELQQTIDDLEVQVTAVNEVLGQVLEACGKSKGQLAVKVREVILGPSASVTEPDPGVLVPGNDADVEEWRSYARSKGYGGEHDLEQLNRSQIRTLLGVPHS